MEKEFEKVDAPIIGADGNVFNLIGICSRELKNNGYFTISLGYIKKKQYLCHLNNFKNEYQ